MNEAANWTKTNGDFTMDPYHGGKRNSHVANWAASSNLKDKSNAYKADRRYINIFKKDLPESVRIDLQMDRWNDKGTWLKKPK